MLIEFILNEERIRTDVDPALPLLDFIRRKQKLTGTKIGCREGDCGACTVLRGKLLEGKVEYRTIVSCLTPLALVQGQHIVTVEGLNLKHPNPVQEAMAANHASQCGFCTPGFVLSFMAYLMRDDLDALQSISGNICRCTGYKSIERAAANLEALKKTFSGEDRIENLVRLSCLPEYFLSIKKRLDQIKVEKKEIQPSVLIGGGSDLMVQIPGDLFDQNITSAQSVFSDQIEEKEEFISIGAAVSIHDFFHHPLIKKYFPDVLEVMPWFASDPIRHMGTLAGNIVNASPIGDLTVTLLALGANLALVNVSGDERQVSLKDFFLSYKKIILEEDEYIGTILLPIPASNWNFHFYKVSKRSYLDIASVNSALGIALEEGRIQDIDLAVGGVAAIPFLARETMLLLKGEKLSNEILLKAWTSLQREVKPISDIRGSSDYKRLLLRQQFFGHFQHLFPGLITEKELHDLLTKELMHEEH
jgi:xanthine dehydrogenase small subunit